MAEEASGSQYEYQPKYLHPGPIQDKMLYRQTKHRFQAVYENKIHNIKTFRLKGRRYDGDFWGIYKDTAPEVKEVIKRAGFEGIMKVGFQKLDLGLITALVERWRPETHTFHFNFREAIVTLQDAEVLFGIRVDGDPVYGTTISRSAFEWRDQCETYLGFRAAQVNGQRVNVGIFEDEMGRALPEDSVQRFEQRARTLILHFISSFMFPNITQNTVYLQFLAQVEDLDQCSRYSLRSALLAGLYSGLCEASQYTMHDATGCLYLLQVWVYERIRESYHKEKE